jgi:hypothetical protein
MLKLEKEKKKTAWTRKEPTKKKWKKRTQASQNQVNHSQPTLLGRRPRRPISVRGVLPHANRRRIDFSGQTWVHARMGQASSRWLASVWKRPVSSKSETAAAQTELLLEQRVLGHVTDCQIPKKKWWNASVCMCWNKRKGRQTSQRVMLWIWLIDDN